LHCETQVAIKLIEKNLLKKESNKRVDKNLLESYHSWY